MAEEFILAARAASVHWLAGLGWEVVVMARGVFLSKRGARCQYPGQVIGGFLPRLSAFVAQSLGQHFLKDGGGDFLNRLGGGGQPSHACAAHHGLGLSNFVAAVF